MDVRVATSRRCARMRALLGDLLPLEPISLAEHRATNPGSYASTPCGAGAFAHYGPEKALCQPPDRKSARIGGKFAGMNVTDLIKAHEGLRLKAYLCPAGKMTIGWGHNLDDVPITQAAADVILTNDISASRATLTANLPWFTGLDAVRQAALIDLCFNLGWQGLGRFRRFLAAMARSDYAAAGAELIDSRWYEQVGDRAPRVVRMVQAGVWP